MVSLGAIPINKLFVPQSTAATSPSFPTAISPYAWIDATQQSAIANGAILATLQDNAVPGRTYTSSGGGTCQTNIRNGKPVIRVGVGSQTYSASSSVAPSGSFLFWAVLKPANPGFLFYNDSLNHQLRFGYGGGYRIALYNGSLIQSDSFTLAESLAWQYVIIARDASNVVRFFYNGASRSVSPPTLSDGFSFNEILAGFQCDFGEAGFAALPSQSAIDDLSAYLVSKWGF